ncbi:protein ROOT HAIR DEFECTIVE 3 homolog 2-like [Durio zibethinus]|uniref:Protein ROOT HAIR DEFECTIVE 3 homolog 2-like n=1 Tax=Durio zibethinus TaxID=66656 RepID=A0A6P6AHI6_DURZI|nr:protein ROOT HAIR DEFECTIVE 3 homolog 2-like [Durio zibethinus]
MENIDHCSMQLINREGEFNVAGVKEFMQKTKFSECGLSYAVVGIMGPQSSGKSTLLNHLFHTNFEEMDASKGRPQTTQGIWIEKCAGFEPCVVAMDLEGTDGSERGEDDTAFEKQSALFALVIADIVIINMWCHNVGLEHAANKPLLRTVFQVMMKLFSARKTTLLFVLRDKTKTSLHYFEHTLRKAAEKIWDSIHKPARYIDTPLSKFFNVEVVALSSYEEKEELFKEEVDSLRQRIDSISKRELASGDRNYSVPASGFFASAQHIWESIKENKDLDLPTHKVMVATIRCEEIVNQTLHQLSCKEDWLAMERAIQSGPVSSFGSKLTKILDICLSEYDKETIYFDEGVRNEKRKQLQSKALDFVRPAYLKYLEHLHFEALENFKSKLEDKLNEGVGFAAAARLCLNSEILQFDQACAEAATEHLNWDNSEVRQNLFHDIDSSKSAIAEEILSKLKVGCEEELNGALHEPLKSLLKNPNEETWASIRELLSCKTQIALSKLLAGISGFELDQEKSNKMVQGLRDYARNVVERKAREEAEMFSVILTDAAGRRDDRTTITSIARNESLRLLSVMAAIRLDEKPDEIENILFSSLMHGSESSETLASSTWPEVSPNDTLITPEECKSVWEDFQAEIVSITQAFHDGQDTRQSRKLYWLKSALKLTLRVGLDTVGVLFGLGELGDFFDHNGLQYQMARLDLPVYLNGLYLCIDQWFAFSNFTIFCETRIETVHFSPTWLLTLFESFDKATS